MRLIQFILVLTCFAAPILAEEQTLLHGKLVHGGYGGPVVKITSIDGSGAVLLGGQGQWLINHTIGLGIAGYGMATRHEYTHSGQPSVSSRMDTVTRNLDVSVGGVLLSYVGDSDQLLHYTADLLIGGGSLQLNADDSRDDSYHATTYYGSATEDNFFVLEPAANVELNIVRFMRANAGISYRFVSGVNRFGYRNSDFGGFSLSLTLKFGKF
jgi:hypothetical protein